MAKKNEEKKPDTKKDSAPQKPRKRLTLRRLAWTLLLLAAPALIVPRWWCGREAAGWYRGELSSQMPLARHVAQTAQSGVGIGDFRTGDKRFDGEWAFGTYMMAGTGLAQVVLQHPETTDELLPAIDTCIRQLLEPGARAFDTAAWENDALATLQEGRGHAAYLGYFNILLGLHRKLVPDSRYVALNDRISFALASRLRASKIALIETYPREVYPVDNAAVIGSIALHHENTGTDHGELLAAEYAALRERYTDPVSGLLYQCVDAITGEPYDKPRASGTALAAYFLSFGIDDSLSRELYNALRLKTSVEVLGFGMVNEYPDNVNAGAGDIDSGPVLFGLSFSGTGFAMSSARIHGDEDFYVGIYRILYLVGSPYDANRKRNFVTGGPLGNAIMLAMLTARQSPRLQETAP